MSTLDSSDIRQNDVPVTMYGADWCRDCRRSKALLDRLQVPYTYRDVAADPEQMNEVLRRNDGAQSIPVIIFSDDSHLTEPSDRALTQRLTNLGIIN